MKDLPKIKQALDKIFEGSNELQPLLKDSLERLNPLLDRSIDEMGISDKVRVAQFLIANFSADKDDK